MILALAQGLPAATEALALTEGLALMDRASASGADLVLFPEMYSIGYRLEGPWTTRALDADGPWVRAFANRAQALGLAVAIPFLERNPNGDPWNAVTVFDRWGHRVLHYRKVHTCAFDAEAALTPGDRFFVAPLDTITGPVVIGAMICFDREFPESARELMLAGAELILVPNACVMERNRQGQLEARAFENGLALALANYAGPEFLGGSSVVSPIVFGSEGQSLDPVVGRAGAGDELLVVDLDLEALRRWAQVEVWNGQWRRPEAYGRTYPKS